MPHKGGDVYPLAEVQAVDMGHWSHDPTYQRNRAILKRQAASANAPCVRCGGVVDYQAKAGPHSFVCGHVVDRALGGTHELSNLQPECARCSARSGSALGLKRRWGKPRQGERSATANRW